MPGFGSRRRRGRYAARRDSTDDEDTTLLNLLLQLRQKSIEKKRKKAATRAKPQKRAKKPTTPVQNMMNDEIFKIPSDDEHEEDNSTHFENIQSEKIDNFFKTRMLLSDSEDEINVNTEVKFTAKEMPKEKKFYTLDSDSDEEFFKASTNTSIDIDIEQPSTSATNDSIIEIEEKVTETVEDILADIDLIAPQNKAIVIEDKEESWNNMLKETEEILESVSKLVGIEKKETEEKKATDTPSKSTPCCPICLENLSNQEVSATVCGHLFCKPCINAVLQSTNKRCPTCRKAINAKKIHPLYL